MHPLVTPSKSFEKQNWERYLADENPILDAKMVDTLVLKVCLEFHFNFFVHRLVILLQFFEFCSLFSNDKQGIHPECRANVWKKLLNVDAMKEYYRSEGIYYNYLRGSGSNSHTAQIKLDLKRTFPTHKLFQQKKGFVSIFFAHIIISEFTEKRLSFSDSILFTTFLQLILISINPLDIAKAWLMCVEF